jgi:hypothetical protein
MHEPEVARLTPYPQGDLRKKCEEQYFAISYSEIKPEELNLGPFKQSKFGFSYING